MEHILDIDGKDKDRLNELFSKINRGNTILFLGAGASIGEKKYLSSELINYYESQIGKSYEISNITEFVDVLSADPTFSRDGFDSFVESLLRKLTVTEDHKVLATIPWKQIITTNCDLLIEQAFDSVRETSDFMYELYPVRSINDYYFTPDNTQTKYIKLNGCISDKRRYPLLFSSDDFNRAKKYYKVVLQDLRNLSGNISFLTIGYSFNDEFAKQLFKKFDSHNFRERRWIFNVDPHINLNRLSYYSQQRICIIKASFQDFFKRYHDWHEQNCEAQVERKRISFTSGKNNKLIIPNKLAAKLANSIVQLNSKYHHEFVSPKDFYKGAEPNYELVSKFVDVVRSDTLNRVKKKIFNFIDEDGSKMVPIACLTGSFGTGKSTFAYRLIYELNNDSDFDVIAFEILDFDKLRVSYLTELFKYSKTKNIILYCNYVEVDSIFKSILELRNRLSIEQFNDFKVSFLIPIRENILEKYKQLRHIKRILEVNVDSNLTETEIIDLVEKLKNAELVYFRDIGQRTQLVDKIRKRFEGDSFITLLNLVTDGNHINDLRDAYSQLSSSAQKAFIYTALLHKFKIMMPASLLKSLISGEWKGDWDDFLEKVIKAEGKGILIQKNVESKGADPDLYFKTKHPLISEALISEMIRTKDMEYEYYQNIFKKLIIGSKNSRLAIDLLKSIFRKDEFSKSKLNKLYDLCYNSLSDDPYFLLYYAINLQYRNSEADIKKGIELLIYAESFFETKNHRFVHRRAVLNFQLAKIYYKKEGRELNLTFRYLDEAKELFEIKLIYDPCSSYSYVDSLKMLFWKLKHIKHSDEEKAKILIKIEDSIDLAEKAVVDDINRIIELKSQYAEEIREARSNEEYKQYLQNMYQDLKVRPYASILLFNYFETIERNPIRCKQLINEMEHYTDNNEIVKFLFKYYGRRLNNPNIRVKFFDLSRDHPIIEETNPLRFYYFTYIAECYSHHFQYAKNSLRNINYKFNYLNPEFHYIWTEPEKDTPRVFDGIIVKKQHGFKKVKIPELQQQFILVKNKQMNYKVHTHVKVILHFYLYGIRAEVIKENIEDK